jgi:HAMP domain-containing protein
MLKNLSVGTRISGGYAVMLLTMVVMTAIGAVQVNKINSALTLINDVNGVKERYAINFRGSAHNRAIAVRDVTMVPAAELPGVVAYIDQQEAAYRKSAEPMDAIFAAGSNVSDAERRQLATIKEKDRNAMTLVREVIAEQQAGTTAEAKAKVLDQARPAFLEWLASINVMIDGEEKLNQEQSAVARGVGLDFQRLMLILTLIAAVVGVLLAIFTTRSMTDPLKQMRGVLEAAAAGDLTQRMDTDRADELGQMAVALNEALESTRTAMVQVDTMIGALAGVSEDLTSAAVALEDWVEAAGDGPFGGHGKSPANYVHRSPDGRSCEERDAACLGQAEQEPGCGHRRKHCGVYAGRRRERRGRDVGDQPRFQADCDGGHGGGYDCVSDQPAGVECRRGGCACGRRRTRICGGGDRSEEPRAAQLGLGDGDQGTDRGFDAEGKPRVRPGEPGDAADRGNCECVGGTVRGNRAGR